MNPFAAYHAYSPMNAFHQGYALGDAFNETQAREEERQRAIRQREALGLMGSGDQLLGFDDVEGATRPAWLKELYKTNPEAALQVEQRVAAPFEIDRAARKAGEIEEAKLKAKVAAWAPFMNDAEGGSGGPQSMPVTGQPVNAFSNYGAPSGDASGLPASIGLVSEGSVGVPGGPTLANPQGVGSDALLMGKNLGGVSRTKKTKKFSLEHGPSVEFENIPDFDVEKAKTEAAQKGRGLELESQKTSDALRVSALQSRKQADDEVYGIQKEISNVQQLMTGTTIRPQDGIRRINELKADLKDAKARRNEIYFGKDAPAPATAELTDEEKAQAKSKRAGGSGTKSLPGAQAPLAASESAGGVSPEVGAGLPYQQQVAVQQEKLKGDITQTRKIIDDSHAVATSSLQNKPATDRIMELLSKEDLGQRWLKLPGGETAATIFSGNYDELNKWRNSLILQEKSEGESQLYNTLPELKIHSASLPSIDNDENTNRRAIVPVKNLMEARMVAPQFLEEWAHQHGGSLDGARQAFRSWMQHNPMYQTAEKNGAVSIHENPHYINLNSWTRLKQRFKEQDILDKVKSGDIRVINGKAYYER